MSISLPNIMNSLKKTLKISIYLLIFGGLLTLFLFIIFFERPKEVIFLTAPNDYYIVNTDANNFINVPIFTLEDNSPYLDKKNILNLYLTSEDETEKFLLDIEEIKNIGKVSFEEKEYYGYDFKLDIPYEINNLLIIKYAKLLFEYPNDESITLNIGSLSIYNYTKKSNLTYSALSGYTKEINNTKILSAVVIKLTNYLPYEIKTIKTISHTIEVNLEHSYHVKDKDDIIISNDYSLLGEGNNVKDIILDNEEYLILYLEYEELLSIECMGFIIEYLENGILYETVILPFKFFSIKNNQKIEKFVYVADH